MQRRNAEQAVLLEVTSAFYGPVLTLTLLFPPERPFVSGNLANRLGPPRSVKGRMVSTMYKSPAAKEQAKYIAMMATATALRARWQMPDYVCMDLIGANIDADRENLHKVIADPLEGICYENDRRIKTGQITLIRDKGPSRVIVAIQAIQGKAFGYQKPSKRKEVMGGHVPFRKVRSNSGKARRAESPGPLFGEHANRA